jgi:A/G-specific adenine glycosylase
VCVSCPFIDNCKAFELDLTQSIPFKAKKVKVQERHIVYFVISSREGLLMKKRIQADIWKDLHDFPSIEVSEKLDNEKILEINVLEEMLNNGYTLLGMTVWVKHQLTHRRIWAKFVVLQSNESELPKLLVEDGSAQYFSNERVEQLGKPILIVNFLKEKSKFNL